MAIHNLSGGINKAAADYIIQGDDELMGGFLRDKLKKVKSKLADKLKTMPKWKRALLAATGLGLIAPATVTTALVAATAVGVPTAIAAGATVLAKKAAVTAGKRVRARIAAKKKAGIAVTAAELSEAQALDEVARTEVPKTVQAPAVDYQATVMQTQQADAAKKSSIAEKLKVALPVVGLGLTALSFLKK